LPFYLHYRITTEEELIPEQKPQTYTESVLQKASVLKSKMQVPSLKVMQKERKWYIRQQVRRNGVKNRPWRCSEMPISSLDTSR
jgi:hypothetical protein